MNKETDKFIKSHETRCKIEKELTEKYRPGYEPHLGTHEHYSPYGKDLHKMSLKDKDELITMMIRLLVHQQEKFTKYQMEILGFEKEFIKKWNK